LNHSYKTKTHVNSNQNFIHRRRADLEKYLEELVAHPFISDGRDARQVAQILLSVLPGSEREVQCYKLIEELKEVLQCILKSVHDEQEPIVYDGLNVERLCYVLENILFHGLRGS
jgi:hypothetical protein